MNRMPLWVLCVSTVACTSTPPPPPPPSESLVTTRAEHFVGTPLAGPCGSLPPLGSAEEALRVHARVVGLSRLPEELLDPLASQARLVLAPGQASSLRGTLGLACGARYGEIPDAEPFLEQLGGTPLAQLHAALPVGCCAALLAEREPRPGALQRVSLLVVRRADGLELALRIVGPGAEGAPAEELVALPSQPGSDRAWLALISPTPFAGLPQLQALAWVVTIRPAPAPGEPGYAQHHAAFVACRGDMARRAVLSELDRGLPAVDPPQPREGGPGLSAAIQAMGDPERRRQAGHGLAEDTGAGLCSDLVLVADDVLLERLATQARAAIRQPGAPQSGAPLGWLLERIAVDVLADALQEPEAPPAAASLLVRHTGGLGLQPATVQALAERTEDFPAWRASLQEENWHLLTDPTLAARVRAWEWLSSRGVELPGYDPFASLGECRVVVAELEAQEHGAPR